MRASSLPVLIAPLVTRYLQDLERTRWPERFSVFVYKRQGPVSPDHFSFSLRATRGGAPPSVPAAPQDCLIVAVVRSHMSAFEKQPGDARAEF